MIKEKFLFSVTGNLFERSSLVFLAALYVRWPRTLERACTSAWWGWGEADCLASLGIMAAHCGSWASALTQHGRCFWRSLLSRRALTLRSSPAAHQNRVSAIIFSLAAEWVISTGHDKCVSWMCTRSGNMLGRHFFASWASCLQYPLECTPSRHSHLTV